MISKFSFFKVTVRAIFATNQNLLILEQWHPNRQNYGTRCQYLWPRSISDSGPSMGTARHCRDVGSACGMATWLMGFVQNA
jgi:hypothetical protein